MGDGSGDVFVFFTLADSLTYTYRYHVAEDDTRAATIAAWLNTAFPDNIPEQYGGVLFNASVRSALVHKSVP